MRLRQAWRDECHRFTMDAARWVRPEEVAELTEVTPGSWLGLLFRHPSLRAMGWFRLAAAAQAAGVRVVPSMIQRRLLTRFGLELVPGADIGGGLYIAHPVGCTLVVDSMGENCSIMAAVTLGRLQQLRWPQIGDRVFIGAGARILGGVKVGNGAIIGANAVVLADVPADAIAVGVPARVIPGRGSVSDR